MQICFEVHIDPFKTGMKNSEPIEYLEQLSNIVL